MIAASNIGMWRLHICMWLWSNFGSLGATASWVKHCTCRNTWCLVRQSWGRIVCMGRVMEPTNDGNHQPMVEEHKPQGVNLLHWHFGAWFHAYGLGSPFVSCGWHLHLGILAFQLGTPGRLHLSCFLSWQDSSTIWKVSGFTHHHIDTDNPLIFENRPRRKMTRSLSVSTGWEAQWAVMVGTACAHWGLEIASCPGWYVPVSSPGYRMRMGRNWYVYVIFVYEAWSSHWCVLPFGNWIKTGRYKSFPLVDMGLSNPFCPFGSG